MNSIIRGFCAAGVAALLAVPGFAQTPPASPATQSPSASENAQQKPDPQKPDPQKPDPQKPAPKPEQKPDPQKPEQPQKYEETVVVSGSRTEEKIVNTPVTMSVVTGAQIEAAPSQNFADLLRTVPGLNITQVSARDINVTTRSATGTLATGQLALLDGRSIYQDFFGFVMWDFLPVNLQEIKQIEVIRGPASAVWGANALNGVVNVITKSPREMQGSSALFGVGSFEREGITAGELFYMSGTHAQAINDRWAYKLSAGVYSQDPLARPTGTIPCERPDVCTPNRLQYPGFGNTGAMQPKFDARVDYDYEDGRKLSFSGGIAGTEGIMHTGIGPFDINNGSRMSYGKVNFTRKGFRAGFFANALDGDARNLLTRTPTNQPITFAFKTKTYDFDVANVQTIAQRHVVNYGGNLRFNQFDLSLAPRGEDRTEFGLYGQDEIFLSDHFRVSLGGRVDRFDYLDDFVFSPRAALMVKPQENHTFRLSFNRAYRSPSVVNNFLDITIAEPINMGLFSPLLAGVVYPLPVKSVGNESLTEQSVDAYEVGYTGIVAGRTVLSAAFYINKSKNDIFFTEVKSGRWTHTNPPPGWPITPLAIAAATGGAGFPGLFTYQNFGEVTQKGIELGVDSSFTDAFSVYANYSYQTEPEPDGFALAELNLPAQNRFNAGVAYNAGRLLANLSVSYSDSAFWQDVLDARYAGTTEAYTLVNAGLGYKWNDRFTTSIKAINLANDDVQQHAFGDVMKRQVVAELRVNVAR